MNSIEMVSKKVEIDKNHIEQFVLETEEGTKRTKEKFYRNAAEQRNHYIEKQMKLFRMYQDTVKQEFLNRIQKKIPQNHNEQFSQDLLEVDHLLDLVKLNTNISNSFKLGISFLIASINNDTSLEYLNSIIKEFLEKFKMFGIPLAIEDFKYSMFCEKYMGAFFQNSDSTYMKDAFEKLYFACPDLKLHLKMNLVYLTRKYEKELERYVLSFKQTEFSNCSVNDHTVIDQYISRRNEVGNEIAIDEYNNSSLFFSGKRKIADYLEGAPAREKNFDLFAKNGNYRALSDEEKNSYDSAMMGFYLTLNELKKYYHYEFILKDLLEKAKNKDSVKTSYLTKKKEIDTEEKNRLGIYKEYLRANGIGLFAKKDDVKIKNSMLKMNEEIKKLHMLYQEYEDLEITYYLSELSESASIYDLFMTSLRSFAFLDKMFSNSEDFQNSSLEENIHSYFRFLFNPNNSVLRKVNVFTDFDIVEIVAEKYRLLNLNVTKEMIDPDSIDSTLDSVQFINFIQNINRSSISLHEIDNLCHMMELSDYSFQNMD